MEYMCDICGEKIMGNSGEYIDHTEGHIMEIIKNKHPDWQEKDGMCKKCYDYYKEQLKGS